MTSSPTITEAQRDALYDQILDRLSGIGDVWLAASADNFETADRLARQYCDELRLLLDDLGWGDGPGGSSMVLTTPPDILRRIFGRLDKGAVSERVELRDEWQESRALEERNRLVGEACRVVLAALDEDER